MTPRQMATPQTITHMSPSFPRRDRRTGVHFEHWQELGCVAMVAQVLGGLAVVALTLFSLAVMGAGV